MKVLFVPLLFLSPLLADIALDQMMTPQEQKETGVSTLTPTQKSALEKWLNTRLAPKQTSAANQVSLALNINGGQKLLLSDRTIYEIAPDDVKTSSAWLTPFVVKIEPSGDPNYPVKLTNPNSGASVKARLVPASPTMD